MSRTFIEMCQRHVALRTAKCREKIYVKLHLLSRCMDALHEGVQVNKGLYIIKGLKLVPPAFLTSSKGFWVLVSFRREREREK